MGLKIVAFAENPSENVCYRTQRQSRIPDRKSPSQYPEDTISEYLCHFLRYPCRMIQLQEATCGGK